MGEDDIPRSKLPEEAWKHIRKRHPEMSRYKELVKEVAFKPEWILRGKYSELKAISLISQTHLGPKYLVVVYHEEQEGEKVIITAYFTSDLKKVKGEVVFGEHSPKAGKA